MANQGDKGKAKKQYRFEINSDDTDPEEYERNEQIDELNEALNTAFTQIAENREGSQCDVKPSEVVEVEQESTTIEDWEMVESTDEEEDEGAGAADGWQKVTYRQMLKAIESSTSTSEDFRTAEEESIERVLRPNSDREDQNTMLWSTLSQLDTVETPRDTEMVIPDGGSIHNESVPDDNLRNGGGETRRRPRRATRFPSWIPNGRRNSLGSIGPQLPAERQVWFQAVDDDVVDLFGPPRDNLIQEQNEAFERVLEEEQRAQNEELDRERQREEERERRMTEAQENLAPEPVEETNNVVQFRIHTGRGFLDRRFSLDDPASILYDYMTSQGYFDVTLETNDREIITRSQMSLRDLGFRGRVGIWTRFTKE